MAALRFLHRSGSSHLRSRQDMLGARMSAGRCRECRTAYTLQPSGRHTLVSCPECGYSHLLLEQPTGLTTLPRVVMPAHEVTMTPEERMFEPEDLLPKAPTSEDYPGVPVWKLPHDHPRYLHWLSRMTEGGRRSCAKRYGKVA